MSKKKSNTKKQAVKDPYAKREAAKYDQPIASRELILSLLKKSHQPLNRKDIELQLEIKSDDNREALRRRLRAMERDGQVIRLRNGRYGLLDKMDLKVGRVQAHKDGYGFVILEGDTEDQDIFLGPRQMQQVFNGDRVAVRVQGAEVNGRKEGIIVEIIERDIETLVGRFFEEGGVGVLIPEHRRIHHKIVIPGDQQAGAKNGEYVVVALTQAPTQRSPARGKVLERLGEYMAPGMEVDVAIRAHNLPHEWSPESLKIATSFSENFDEKTLAYRHDCRKLPFVTIDGEDARDFDDAVYAKPKASGGWQLFVAIADVSHYVEKSSALDLEARERSTSVYFPGRVVPMLPEALSNNLCSLNPLVDRLAMICEMSISASGKLTRFKFYEAVIQSHARLTYHQVADFLDKKPESVEFFNSQHADLVQPIQTLYALYQVLLSQRAVRGAMDFSSVETQILFGPNKKIQEIIPRQRNEAHRLIEEMMLCANISAAKTLLKNSIPALYRNHGGVKPEKWNALRTSLAALGISINRRGLPKPEDYQTILASIGERKDAHIIETLLLRSMSQAKYESENQGHFGLNYPAYAHFTSPIRRYPDLVVHRALRYLIRNQRDVAQVVPIKGARKLKQTDWLEAKLEDLIQLGEHCSMVERRADDATRDVESWLKCEYMKDRIGDVLRGVISSVVGFGLFIELTDIYVEGLIHISNLPGDYYHFDEVRLQLTGEHTGKRFNIGDKILVQVSRVDIDERKIDFSWAEQGENTNKRSKKKGTKKESKTKPKQKKEQNKRGTKSGDKTDATKKKVKRNSKSKPASKPTLKAIKKGAKSNKKKETLNEKTKNKKTSKDNNNKKSGIKGSSKVKSRKPK